MSSPVTISYPDWWDRDLNGYPDIEKLLADYLGPMITGITTTYWLPDQQTIDETLANGGGFLRIYRVGGSINDEQNRDEPNVQIAALTQSRDKSWDLIEFVRTGVLEQFRKAAVVPGTKYQMHMAGGLVGPQLIPEQLRDDRLVPMTVTLHTWRVSGKSFRQALGL
jgi:hypothetical protein